MTAFSKSWSRLNATSERSPAAKVADSMVLSVCSGSRAVTAKDLVSNSVTAVAFAVPKSSVAKTASRAPFALVAMVIGSSIGSVRNSTSPSAS